MKTLALTALMVALFTVQPARAENLPNLGGLWPLNDRGRVLEPEDPNLPLIYISEELQLALEDEIREIQAEKKPWKYWLEDRNIRLPMWCRNECTCLVMRTKNVVNEMDPTISAADAFVQTGVGVKMLRDAIPGAEITYAFHHSLFLYDGESFGVIDYLMFGDVKPRSFKKWKEHFVHQQGERFGIRLFH